MLGIGENLPYSDRRFPTSVFRSWGPSGRVPNECYYDAYKAWPIRMKIINQRTESKEQNQQGNCTRTGKTPEKNNRYLRLSSWMSKTKNFETDKCHIFVIYSWKKSKWYQTCQLYWHFALGMVQITIVCIRRLRKSSNENCIHCTSDSESAT